LIGYLEGKILAKEEDRILLFVNQVGYEVMLPAIVMDALSQKTVGDDVALYIYHQQTERQPKPVLIGFSLEAEKAFFQHFISVEDIGPMKAVKALNIPIRDIARAIELKDTQKLMGLKGIGKRTAQKIIATLEGKMEKFALIRKPDSEASPPVGDVAKQVMEVLAGQLGHRMSDAKRMVTEAMNRNENISTPEELFDEVYRGEVDR
jgi:holliday junction DNA helicase RuvA